MDGADNVHLPLLLEEIDPDRLRKRIGVPIDEARNTFFLERATVATRQECFDIVTAFYLHLYRHTSQLLGEPEEEAVREDAGTLLEKAFVRRGGLEAAIAESQLGVHGGLRYVLEAVTSQVKLELTEKCVARAFKVLLADLDYDERVELLRAFMKTLAPFLPDEAAGAPPEAYVEKAEELIRTYVQSMDRIRHWMRTI